MVEVEAAPCVASEAVHPDALIREARRRQRRRWIAIAAVLIVGASVVVSLARSTHHASKPRQSRQQAVQHQQIRPEVRISGPQPRRPGSLALGPDGTLYIADDARDQILALRDGTFRVVVGSGKVGFAGDGGPAVKAEINNPAGITVAADGTLYFADSLNSRVRSVSRSGIITTVAGNGQIGWIVDGTAALAASLNPYALTFGPNGDMYVAADQQVLRLNADGTFTRVLGNRKYDGPVGFGGPARHGSADGALGLAFDSTGDLFVFGSSAKDLLMVDPNGTLTRIGGIYPRGYGGLVTAPDGNVIAMTEDGVAALSPRGVRSIFVTLHNNYRKTFHGVHGFSPNGIAIGHKGTIYLDTFWGNGYSDRSAIVAIRSDGTSSLLWDQKPPTTSH